jgi:hypothetical protein
VALPFQSTGYLFASIGLDGSLLVVDPETLAVGALRPNAAAFVAVVPVNGHLAYVRAGARYLSSSASLVDGRVKLGDGLAHSADGTTWTEIPYSRAKA